MRALVLVVLLVSSPALGATSNIDCSGGDTLSDLQSALDQANCGDVIRVKGVCEAFGAQLSIDKVCSAGNELTIENNGAAEINGTYPDYRSQPNNEWILVDASLNEYVSVDSFSSWNGSSRGFFLDPGAPPAFAWNTLVPYDNLTALRKSEYGKYDDLYAGPGVAYDAATNKLHIRLANLDGIEADCGIYNPGDLNPNNIALEIFHGFQGVVKYAGGTAFIIWDGVDIIGGKHAMDAGSDAHDLVFKNARFRGHKVPLLVKHDVYNVLVHNMTLENLVAPWLTWKEVKNGLWWDGTGMIGFNTGSRNKNITVSNSFFDRPFDMMSPSGEGQTNYTISGNVVNWTGDDAFQLGCTDASYFSAFDNQFLRSANTWSRHGSGATLVKGSLYFYRNIIDTYHDGLKLHSKPTSPGANAARASNFKANYNGNGGFYASFDDPGVTRDDNGGCFQTKSAHGTHGSGGAQAVKYYNNTYFLGGGRTAAGGWQKGKDSGSTKHLKRNVIVWHRDQPVVEDWLDNSMFDADGNIYHNPNLSSGTTMFKSMPSSYKSLAEYVAATGNQPNSLQVDPQLSGAVPGGAYCPSASGPANQPLIALDPVEFPGVAGIAYVGAVNPATCGGGAPAAPAPPILLPPLP